MRTGIRPPKPYSRTTRPMCRGPPSEEMLNCAVSGDILKKYFRLMTLEDAKVFHRDSKGRGFELPHQGVSSVGERGHRLTERRPPFPW